MYYDDEARRFNFMSGLLFGGVLGAGLALLVAPQKRVRKPQRLRRGYGRVRAGAGSGIGALREGAESLGSRFAQARKYLD